MIKDITKAYSEVYEILQLLDKVYVNKIPQKFLNLIEKEKDINYIPNIRPNIPLENQHLLEDTINILAMLKIDYWCSDENEKLELIKFCCNSVKQLKSVLNILKIILKSFITISFKFIAISCFLSNASENEFSLFINRFVSKLLNRLPYKLYFSANLINKETKLLA